MEKRTCLCVPSDYPMSETIADVKKRTELNGSGTLTELPATNVIAIASPTALPVPSTIAVAIPLFAAGIKTRNTVCILVAPRASEAAFMEAGTARSADSVIVITVGRIMIVKTITADNKFEPPVN